MLPFPAEVSSLSSGLSTVGSTVGESNEAGSSGSSDGTGVPVAVAITVRVEVTVYTGTAIPGVTQNAAAMARVEKRIFICLDVEAFEV